MIINNKDLIQSYILTSAKYDYSVYEKRILYRVIEMMQSYTKGKKLNEKYFVQKTMFDDLDISMPLSAFLKGENDNNYKRVKEALLSLNNKVLQFEDDKIWQALNLIERPQINKNDSYITFRVSPMIAKAFMDFSKGYSKYELATAMEFESVYSMRFYELLSEQKTPITYTIDSLKIMFKIEDKYKKTNDFIRKIVITAKKELDEKSPYSFEYRPIKKGRSITSIMFYPIYQSNNRDLRIEDKKLKKQISIRFELDKITINYLQENYFFSSDEIKNNLELFTLAQSNIDLLYFLSEQKRNAESKTNPKGWIINAIKNQLNQAKIQNNE